MHPILLILPSGARVLAAPICVLVAIVIGAVLTARLAQRRRGLPFASVVAFALSVGLLGFLGGRVHFALAYPEYFTGQWWRVLNVFEGGRHVPGAILAVIMTAPLLARAFGLRFRDLADCGTVGVLVGVAVARVGCFLHGCCFGRECIHWWCVRYPPTAPIFNLELPRGVISSAATSSLPIHPLPLYFAGLALVVAAVARWQMRREHSGVAVMWTAVLLVSSGNAALEPLRYDFAGRRYWGTLPQLQWMAIGLAIVAGVGLMAHGRWHRRSPRW